MLRCPVPTGVWKLRHDSEDLRSYHVASRLSRVLLPNLPCSSSSHGPGTSHRCGRCWRRSSPSDSHSVRLEKASGGSAAHLGVRSQGFDGLAESPKTHGRTLPYALHAWRSDASESGQGLGLTCHFSVPYRYPACHLATAEILLAVALLLLMCGEGILNHLWYELPPVPRKPRIPAFRHLK